jgi:hypothetical protein
MAVATGHDNAVCGQLAMAKCLLCPFRASRGHLCEPHGRAIATPSLTPEQLRSAAVAPEASLVDAWGGSLALSRASRVGRDARVCDVEILHASVSREHARFHATEVGWVIEDLNSRNGTYVNDALVSVAALVPHTRVRFGEATFYFVPHVVAPVPRRLGPGRTARIPKIAAAEATSFSRLGKPCVLAERASGGFLRVDRRSVDLSTLEYQLLRDLVEARIAAPDAERAWVPCEALAARLPFVADGADDSNVRELVHRMRLKLADLGELIESRRGLGYRIDIVHGS